MLSQKRFDATLRPRWQGVWLSTLACGLMIARAARPAPAQASQRPPQLDNARYPEDYSSLRDPANRTGAWLEDYKLIPRQDGAFRGRRGAASVVNGEIVRW